MAKAFTFRLETVLKLRKQREDEQKRMVANRLREVQRARIRCGSLEEQIDVEIEVMRSSALVGMIEAGRIARHRHWLSHLNRQVLETEGDIRTLQAKLAMEQSQLAEAAKECNVLKKLKERQLDRYRRMLAKREQNESDEMTTMRYVYHREAQ